MSAIGPATDASPWVVRWSHLVPAGATVLDLACGGGRHSRWFASRGARVIAVDRDAAAVAALRHVAEAHVADLEAAPWPFPDRRFDAVVVTNYLWRPLWPALREALGDGGVLIYETFADGQQAFGRPQNPDFLLRRGELITAAEGLTVVAYEDGVIGPPARCVQRLVARRASSSRPVPLTPEALVAPG